MLLPTKSSTTGLPALIVALPQSARPVNVTTRVDAEQKPGGSGAITAPPEYSPTRFTAGAKGAAAKSIVSFQYTGVVLDVETVA